MAGPAFRGSPLAHGRWWRYWSGQKCQLHHHSGPAGCHLRGPFLCRSRRGGFSLARLDGVDRLARIKPLTPAAAELDWCRKQTGLDQTCAVGFAIQADLIEIVLVVKFLGHN